MVTGNDTVEYLESEKLFHGHIPLIMGTRFDLVAVGSGRELMEDVWQTLLREARETDGMLNRFSDESEVGRLNKACDIRNQSISEELGEILRIARDYREKTLGLFDVAGGKMGDIFIDEEGRISLMGNRLDFGGFAKGYFLEYCRSLLVSKGVTDAFVDFGDSSILALGHHPCGDCWKVGVVNPFNHTVISNVELRNRTLSTSGNTPSYDGHIVNPRTGEPVTGRKMVAVSGDSPLDVEVLSTALMMADEDERGKILAFFPGAEYEIYDL